MWSGVDIKIRLPVTSSDEGESTNEIFIRSLFFFPMAFQPPFLLFCYVATVLFRYCSKCLSALRLSTAQYLLPLAP
nr:MAG TPA: hypothetical protein [Caudoviricetes sp.]